LLIMILPANAWFGLWASAGCAPRTSANTTNDEREIVRRFITGERLADAVCRSRPPTARSGSCIQKCADGVEAGAIGRVAATDPRGDLDRAACKHTVNFGKLRARANRVEVTRHRRQIAAAHRSGQPPCGAVRRDVAQRALGERDQGLRGLV